MNRLRWITEKALDFEKKHEVLCTIVGTVLFVSICAALYLIAAVQYR